MIGVQIADTVELVMAFEEKFGIEIPDDAAETIQTVQNAIDYIESKNKLIYFYEKNSYSGIGLLTSLGNNKEQTWNNLINCKSGVKKVEHFM